MMATRLLAIDPGTTESAWVEWDGCRITGFSIADNEVLLGLVANSDASHLVVEQVASYGMPVGAEIFETVFWTGRFIQAWEARHGANWSRVKRKDVVLHHCGSSRAKDGNVRQALIDRLGPPGTKKAPGATYGVSKDVWQALGLALVWWDKEERRG